MKKGDDKKPDDSKSQPSKPDEKPVEQPQPKPDDKIVTRKDEKLALGKDKDTKPQDKVPEQPKGKEEAAEKKDVKDQKSDDKDKPSDQDKPDSKKKLLRKDSKKDISATVEGEFKKEQAISEIKIDIGHMNSYQVSLSVKPSPKKGKKEVKEASGECSLTLNKKPTKGGASVNVNPLEKVEYSCHEPYTLVVECNAVFVKQRCDKVHIGFIFEKNASKSFDPNPNASVQSPPPIRKKKLSKRLSKRREKTTEIKVTSPTSETVEMEFLMPEAQKPEIRTEMNVSRKRTASGTSDIFMEIDVVAGEEIAHTDALIDLNFFDFEETEMSIFEGSDDEFETESESEGESLLSVDVEIESVSEEDGINVFPTQWANMEASSTVMVPSSESNISRRVEESKMGDRADAVYEPNTFIEAATLTIGMETHGDQKIIEHPQAVTLQSIDDSVTLICRTERPIRTAVWFRSGMVVSEGEHLHIAIQGNETVLTIDKFSPYFFGAYHVLIDDQLRSVPARVTAPIAPKIQTVIRNPIVHQAGKTFDTKLAYIAYPPPNVKLLHNDNPITLTVHLEQYDDYLSIRIKNLRKEDAGTLTITLQNDHGEDTAILDLKLVDTPLAPRHSRLVRVTDTTATIRWIPPKRIGDGELKNYIIERKTAESSRWRRIAETNETMFTAVELVPNEIYAFRVKAVNSYGEGLPGKTIEVDTLLDEEVAEFEYPFDEEAIKMQDLKEELELSEMQPKKKRKVKSKKSTLTEEEQREQLAAAQASAESVESDLKPVTEISAQEESQAIELTVEQYPEITVSLDTTETPSDDKKESSGKKKKVRKSKSDLEADSSISESISTEINTEIGIEESKSAFSVEESISITTSSEQGESLPQDGDVKKKKVTKRKPSSDTLSKSEDQPQLPSSDSAKLDVTAPESQVPSEPSQDVVSVDDSKQDSDGGKKKKVTKRKPSSDTLSKGEDQPQLPSSDDQISTPESQVPSEPSKDISIDDSKQESDEGKKKKVTKRKPSSDKISKDEEQSATVPSSEEPKSEIPPSSDSAVAPSDSTTPVDDSKKKKVTKRKESSDKISKDESSVPAVPAEITSIVPQIEDVGEFTVKISAATKEESEPAVPGDVSSVVQKTSDEGEFTAKIPGSEEGDSKKKKLTKRKPSSDKISKDESTTPGETSSVVPTSGEQQDLVAKIPPKSSTDESQKPSSDVQQVPGEASGVIPATSDQQELTAKVPSKPKDSEDDSKKSKKVSKRTPSQDKVPSDLKLEEPKISDQEKISSVPESKQDIPNTDVSGKSVEPSTQEAEGKDGKKKKVTTRKPSSEKLVKEGDQPQTPSSDDSKTTEQKSDVPVPSDQVQPSSSQDASDSTQPDGGKKKKVTARKPSSDKISKDESQVQPPSEPVVSKEASGIAQAVGDESEFTTKISLKDGTQSEVVEGVPSETSGIISKSGDEGEFTAKLPESKPSDDEKKGKVKKRAASKDKLGRQDSTPSEASGVVPVSQEQTELTAKIPSKKIEDSQSSVPGEVSTTIPSSGEQQELTAKIPSKKLDDSSKQESVEGVPSSGDVAQTPSDDGSKKKKKVSSRKSTQEQISTDESSKPVEDGSSSQDLGDKKSASDLKKKPSVEEKPQQPSGLSELEERKKKMDEKRAQEAEAKRLEEENRKKQMEEDRLKKEEQKKLDEAQKIKDEEAKKLASESAPSEEVKPPSDDSDKGKKKVTTRKPSQEKLKKDESLPESAPSKSEQETVPSEEVKPPSDDSEKSKKKITSRKPSQEKLKKDESLPESDTSKPQPESVPSEDQKPKDSDGKKSSSDLKKKPSEDEKSKQDSGLSELEERKKKMDEKRAKEAEAKKLEEENRKKQMEEDRLKKEEQKKLDEAQRIKDEEDKKRALEDEKLRKEACYNFPFDLCRMYA
ncbi:hypothetical protein WR25_04766 isoform D [Diploscapter pachys]|nr:hypothetical protein WR25_04766 isoform B [Diploscapter pachys]PAV63178.1 hypothetical protein WR25_04766 isoform D [Diploscapter pachys]